MPYRLTKIYTRQGDEGHTSLGKKRLLKNDPLIEAIGTIDELNSFIGFIISLSLNNKQIENCLTQIQHELFDIGGELYSPQHIVITKNKITHLEQVLDEWNNTLPPLEEFILPRGTPQVAATHLARTVCRRAERCLVHLHTQTPLANPELLKYLNRLSDLLFVLARILGRDNQEKETLWDHERK
ncbi:MAG: cob(I)yrinic acid a,c-diamide adenosyltransferase [Gammaproteobacteria bacterium]|nr:cob(I)yrinic acid a,c-diamide adenosyltransferase [Gammaproteobacteria bacterium]